jgi:hypothetical protein
MAWMYVKWILVFVCHVWKDTGQDQDEEETTQIPRGGRHALSPS